MTDKLQIEIEVKTDDALKSIHEIEKALARLEFRMDNIKKRLWIIRFISWIKRLFKK